ncbi:MAG TPA: hypothetical protein VGF94_25250 [Kofleriaceae bacterium]
MRGLLVVAAVMVVSGVAHAGRTYYGWLYGTEVLPERGAEWSSWLQEQNGQDPNNFHETRWWTAPLIGITDQLELALPIELAWNVANDQNPRTTFDEYGAELRYRLVSQDPIDAPGFVPLIRVALYRSIIDRNAWIPQADFVLSYEQGPVHALVDLGGYGEIDGVSSSHFEFHPGAGFSIRAFGDVRLGAEAHAELSFDDGSSGNWAVVGPNMAWSHGRTWLSAAYGIGVYGIRDAPRVQWGIAF